MTPVALLTLVTTWIIIASFTGYFFIKVLRTPQGK